MSKNKICCPTCGQSVNKRKITLFNEMVASLVDVYKWCCEHNTHEFTRKQIKHLLKTENQTARFGDWQYFGGIIYKNGKRGHWGMNMERAYNFLTGQEKINTVCLKDPIQHTNELSEPKYWYEVKKVHDLLDDEDMFISEYN